MTTFEKQLAFLALIAAALLAASYVFWHPPESADLSDITRPAIRCMRAKTLPRHEARLACHDFCKNVEKYLGAAELLKDDDCKPENLLTQ